MFKGNPTTLKRLDDSKMRAFRKAELYSRLKLRSPLELKESPGMKSTLNAKFNIEAFYKTFTLDSPRTFQSSQRSRKERPKTATVGDFARSLSNRSAPTLQLSLRGSRMPMSRQITTSRYLTSRGSSRGFL